MNQRITIKALVILALFTTGLSTEASVPASQTLQRENIQNLKIISTEFDRINFYITHTNTQKFRIGELSQIEAEAILSIFKENVPLKIQTVATQHDYLEVTAWE